MGNTLKARLGELNPKLAAALSTVNAHSELIKSLTVTNVLSLATILWSLNFLNDEELDKVTSLTSSRKATKKLLKLIFMRGDKGLKCLATALEDIEMPEFAEKLRSVAAMKPTTELPANEEGGVKSSDDAATDAATDAGDYGRLSENLTRNYMHIAERLTTGETDTIIVQLRTHREKYLQVMDYEEIKAIKSDVRKATELIDKLLKNERAIPYFAKSLRDIGRPELCDLIRKGRVA